MGIPQLGIQFLYAQSILRQYGRINLNTQFTFCTTETGYRCTPGIASSCRFTVLSMYQESSRGVSEEDVNT